MERWTLAALGASAIFAACARFVQNDAERPSSGAAPKAAAAAVEAPRDPALADAPQNAASKGASLSETPEPSPLSPSESAISPIEGDASTARARRPGAYANVDPEDDGVVGPPDTIDDCEGALERAGVKFRRATLAVHAQKKSGIVCGAPQVVTYLRGPGKITYNAPPLLTCTMALALAAFETVVQEEAEAAFHSPVARIEQLGTYNCREMARYKGWVSEHSYANAIDIASFTLKNGRSIVVLRDFDTGADPPKTPAGVFLRTISRRANDEEVFSLVLTPFFDPLHKNHFHLDLARYHLDGTRP